MSTSESHDNQDEIITENTKITQDEAQTHQTVSEAQENETESFLIKKPLKRKLKKEPLPLTEDYKLIQLVRCMRCLYDPQHPRHQDSEVRKDLWDIIGKSMDLPGNECGRRWSNLKKKYKHAIKNKKRGYACAEYWKKLIDKFTKSKDKKRNYKELNWLLEYISTDEAESENSDTDRQKKINKPSEEVAFLHDIHCQCNTATLAHPMQKFLAEIATILKNLPPQQQNLAKLEIFEITNKFDLKKSIELTVPGIKTEIDSDE